MTTQINVTKPQPSTVDGSSLPIGTVFYAPNCDCVFLKTEATKAMYLKSGNHFYADFIGKFTDVSQTGWAVVEAKSMDIKF